MVIFFSILLTLLSLNVILLLVSVNHTSPKERTLSKKLSRSAASEIHPMDLILPKYKKAV